MNQLNITDYLSIEVSQSKVKIAELENRLADIESGQDSQELTEISNRIDRLDKSTIDLSNTIDDLDDDTVDLYNSFKRRSGLMSTSWWTRATTTWAYVLSVQLIIGIIVGVILVVFSLIATS